MINKAEINLNLEKISEYKKIYYKKLNLKSIRLKKGTINFFEDKKYITNITDIKFNHILSKNSSKTILKGKFLNDKIYFKLKNKKNDKKISANIILKLIDAKLLTKISIFNLPSKTDSISGNILLKKDKNRLSSTFIYKDKQLVFLNPQVSRVNMMGQDTFQVIG